MALSDTQKSSVVFYLGWPGKSIVSGSVDYNTQVVSALNNLTVPIETRVIATLDRLEAIDQKLDGAACRLSAKKVDEIELNPDEVRMLRSERRRLARLLSQLLDIQLLGGGGVNVNVCV